MVPQPIDELEARANDVFKIALTVGAAGLLSAVLLGLLIAGAFSSALRNVVSVTRTIRSGDLDSRVGKSSNFTPAEFGELAVAVNQMADHLRDDQAVMVNALHDAKMADRAKTEFLANMSHELRTPLNAIIGFSDMLRQKMADPEKVAVYAEDINSSGRHLLDIIVEILDISRIEAGQVELVCEEVDIAAFVAGAVKLIEPQAESFDITIEVDIRKTASGLRQSAVEFRKIHTHRWRSPCERLDRFRRLHGIPHQRHRYRHVGWGYGGGAFSLRSSRRGVTSKPGRHRSWFATGEAPCRTPGR
jgi:signal transduction histidine kinase